MQAINLANNSTQNKRKEADFYPTPTNVTEALISFIKGFVAADKLKVWEPACGDGAMSKVLQNEGYDVVSTDIRDTGFGVGGIDYLLAPPEDCDAIITNPPFKLSSEFISKAIQEVPIVAMVLKSQYWHASKRTELFKEHPPAWVLPLNWRPDFLNGERGGSPTMECLWTVWILGQTDTRYRILEKPKVKG